MTQPLNENKCNIQCEWMDTNRLLINPDGQVLPCCYFANVIYTYDKLGVPGKIAEKPNQVTYQMGNKLAISEQTKSTNILMNYYQNREKYNINENSLEDIITSDWFVKTLPESWDDSDKIASHCVKHCTKKSDE